MESTISAYREEFMRKARISREQQARLDFEFFNKVRKHDEAEKIERQKSEAFDRQVAMILATPQEIADFEVKLDSYDAATVEALMQNEQELKAVQEQIDGMLLEAHTLPDGRRVFKTRDGKHVFDEHGQELKAEEISPEQIDNDKPRWEDFQAADTKQETLQQERSDLLEYQGNLDKTRDRLDDPSLSKNELDALDRKLGQSMPDRVRSNLGKDAPANDADRDAQNDVAPTAPRAADTARRDPQFGR